MKKKLLIVEDEHHLRNLYKMEFEQDGFWVLDVPSGEKALSFLQDNEVDLVLLDLQLTGMSGLETLRELLNYKRDLKVVINTAYPTYKFDFSSWNADAFVVKSSDMAELKRVVSELLPFNSAAPAELAPA